MLSRSLSRPSGVDWEYERDVRCTMLKGMLEQHNIACGHDEIHPDDEPDEDLKEHGSFVPDNVSEPKSASEEAALVDRRAVVVGHFRLQSPDEVTVGLLNARHPEN